MGCALPVATIKAANPAVAQQCIGVAWVSVCIYNQISYPLRETADNLTWHTGAVVVLLEPNGQLAVSSFRAKPQVVHTGYSVGVAVRTVCAG